MPKATVFKKPLAPKTVVKPKVQAPVKQKVQAPVKQKVQAPVKQEVKTPVKQKVLAPVKTEVETKISAEEDWDEEYERKNEEEEGNGETIDNEESEPMEEEEDGSEQEMEGEEQDEQDDSDPTTLFRMSIARTSSMLSSGDIKKFLNIKQIKVMKVTQPAWIPIAEVRVCDSEDKEKLSSLTGRKVGGFEVKFEVIGETDMWFQAPVTGESSVVKAEGLPARATVKDLQDLFPNVKEVRIPISKAGQKRTALLEFNSQEDADKVLADKQGIKLHDEELVLKAHKIAAPVTPAAVPSDDVTTTDENKKVLFVGNLLYETTEETVKAYFDTCEYVRLLRFGPLGKSKGMGFVHFGTAAAALKALIEKKDTTLEGRQILLQFADGERRTAEDYRNKPANTRSFRGRPKPYSTPGPRSVPKDRWLSRAEVEKGLSFANIAEESHRGMSSWGRGREQRPTGMGMGASRPVRDFTNQGIVTGDRFRNEHRFPDRGSFSGRGMRSAYQAPRSAYQAPETAYQAPETAYTGSSGNVRQSGFRAANQGQSGFRAANQGQSGFRGAEQGQSGFRAAKQGQSGYRAAEQGQSGFRAADQGQSGYRAAEQGQSGYRAAEQGQSYRNPQVEAQMNLREELERTRRLERQLQMALEQKAGYGEAHGAYNRGTESTAWRDDNDQYTAYNQW